MCGRFALYSSFQAIKDYADLLSEIGDIDSNYNVAPGQEIPIIIKQDQQNILRACRWGLIPFWAKDENIGYKLINTRSETIAEKPSFKYAFQQRRCLIPANGFYEWRKTDKQPFYVTLQNRELFSFAGIWEIWKSPAGKQILSCSIITASANDKLSGIHHRMPVILPKEHEETWLRENNANILHNLLISYPSEEILFHPVSFEVNSVRNNCAELIKAI
ncbi:MAG: SOS response-associated peptidase [Candidatus Cloacimonetes bacterium]|jgi:putative SOS response-associated peptidase YedK|nr:SOS response-associated peptidase [Candidatus Cloacimonadota bacterium]